MLLCWLSIPVVSADTLYKCTDASGVVRYTNQRGAGCVVLTSQKIGETASERQVPPTADEIARQHQEEFERVLKDYQEALQQNISTVLPMYQMQEAAKGENPLALAWLRSESSKNSSAAMVALGYYFLGKEDGDNAVAQFKKAAQLGNADAYSELASVYNDGFAGVAKDPKVGCEWYKKSAEAGYFRDAVEYGSCLFMPVSGLRRDMNEGCRWGAIGADGYVKELSSNKLVEKYPNSAYAKRLKVAAARAYGLLAICLHDNPDTKTRIADAAKWYKLSAELGNAVSSFLYGELLEQGRGVVQDYSEAARWYRNSAESGFVAAQNRLGAKYAEGRGVQKSMIEAMKWFMIAAANGDEKAVENRDKAEKSLSAGDVKRAQALAAEWMKKNNSK